MDNICYGNTEKKFYAWVHPKDFLASWNMGIIGKISSLPPENANTFEDNLLFIPNPKYQGDISPYHNNVSRKYRTEYNLEINRPEQYPSRMQSFFAFDSHERAIKYKQVHKPHVEGRILINAHTYGDYQYSIHDSGWFDFLCMDMACNDMMVTQSTAAYWKGLPVQWSQPPTWEVLFYGRLNISEDSKQILKAACLQSPFMQKAR